MANYVDDGEFLAEMTRWRDSSDDPGKRSVSGRLGEILLLLHDGVLRHDKFRRCRQADKEDMRSYSLERILRKGLYTFRFDGSSPFKYFTCGIFLNYACWLRTERAKARRKEEYAARVEAARRAALPAQPVQEFTSSRS